MYTEQRLKALKIQCRLLPLILFLKKIAFKYFKNNYYYHKEGHVWTSADYTEENWPLCYALFFSASSRSAEYAESMTILTYMRYDEVKQWENTFNTVSAEKTGAKHMRHLKNKKQKYYWMMWKKNFRA